MTIDNNFLNCLEYHYADVDSAYEKTSAHKHLKKGLRLTGAEIIDALKGNESLFTDYEKIQQTHIDDKCRAFWLDGLKMGMKLEQLHRKRLSV